jgi:inward rectifier potassium channel
MEKPSFDPGLTQRYEAKLRRVIRKDGEFNVRRKGTTWRDIHPFIYLINRPWYALVAILFGGLVGIDLVFTLIYFALGVNQLQGAEAATALGRFLNAFFFSSQTLTTEGYGRIYPATTLTNLLASLESMMGLMGFAMATGFLVARLSRPRARIGFSRTMLVAPYNGARSVQFRIVNRGVSNLMEVHAQMLLMTVEQVDGNLQRKYTQLKLERDGVLFLAVTWTIVHAVDADSPLYGKTAEDLERWQAEFLILIKGVDDTFSQTVHARASYRYDELTWGARFAPAFHVDSNGDLELEVDRVSDVIESPAASPASKSEQRGEARDNLGKNFR